jgi:hypothetical protein
MKERPAALRMGWTHAIVTSWQTPRRSRDADREIPANRYLSEVRDLLGAMQAVCAAKVRDFQGLLWCSAGRVLVRIAGDYPRFWGFQALGNPSA